MTILLFNEDVLIPATGVLHTHNAGNNGTADLVWGTAAIVPVAGDVSVWSIEADNVSGQTFVPGQTGSIGVRFDPVVAGTYEATLRLPSSDPDGALTVELLAIARDLVSLAPVMAVDPVGTVDFGSVDITTGSKVVAFVVSNPGTGPLIMGTVALTGSSYAKSADGVSGVTIAPGTSQGLYVTLDPATIGTKTGTLTFPATGLSSVVVNLTGVGTTGGPAPTPSLVTRFYLTRQASPVAAISDFGAWAVNTPDPDCLLATARGGPAVSLGPVVPHGGVSGFSSRLGRWVSPPLAAQSHDGAFTAIAIGYRSSYLGSNVTSALRFGIWRVADSSVDWQPILALGAAASPWPDSSNPLPRRFPAGASGAWSTPLDFLSGDRLVVELGFRAFSTSTNGARIRYGGASTDTDLGDWETVQDLARAPWISFVGGILVLP